MFQSVRASGAPCDANSPFDPDLCPDRLCDVAETLMRGDEEQQRLACELLRLAARLRTRPD